MCMLTYLPPTIQPNLSRLTNGARINDDGHGYSIVIPDDDTHRPRLLTRRSLSATYLLRQFVADRLKYPDGPAMFHSRWGTSGVGTKYNCHPFYVGGDRRTVVAHNGILPAHMQPAKGDRRCDTRLAADSLLTSHGHLSGHKARRKLAEEIGAYNKLVILTIDPAFDSWSYIVNEDEGQWASDIWYSNFDYLGRQYVTYKGSTYVSTKGGSYRPTNDWQWEGSSYARPANADCAECLSKGTVDAVTAVCVVCWACADCGGYDNCLCYLPIRAKDSTNDALAELASYHPNATTADYLSGYRP